jgi:hypothetical protein
MSRRRRRIRRWLLPVAELRLVSGVSLLGKLEGQFANRSQTNAGTAIRA